MYMVSLCVNLTLYQQKIEYNLAPSACESLHSFGLVFLSLDRTLHAEVDLLITEQPGRILPAWFPKDSYKWEQQQNVAAWHSSIQVCGHCSSHTISPIPIATVYQHGCSRNPFWYFCKHSSLLIPSSLAWKVMFWLHKHCKHSLLNTGNRGNGIHTSHAYLQKERTSRLFLIF